MSAKTLLPNQCDLLHPYYGMDNCCLCKAHLEIEQLRQRIEELEMQSHKDCKVTETTNNPEL